MGLPPTKVVKVQVWHYELDRHDSEQRDFESLLTRRELDRAARFRLAKHRRRFVTNRGRMREILASYANTEPQNIRFARTEHGKPYITGPEQARDIRFSVSTTHHVGALACCRDGDIGLDIELDRPISDHNDIVRNEFSEDEQNWFFQLSASCQQTAFYRLWTCNEAYLKGKGLGLTVPLDSFAVNLAGDRPRLAWSNLDKSDGDDWSLYNLELADNIVACLAITAGECVVDVDRWPGR